MDNDDDFQSQNFQLLAEDSNKFPSSLRLFPLPNFELDDHLQFHLRFDGLVEREPLLGIQHQEQTNWIEDFTPGNDALELSSSATESCTISRQKNIWSEATSSESVEMLLKSVGEVDMMNESVNVIHSESQSGLNSVTDHMHACCCRDDSLQSEEDKAIDADPVLLPGQHCKALSSFDKDLSPVPPDVPGISDTSNDGPGNRIFEALDKISEDEKTSDPKKVVTELCGLNEILATHAIELSAIREKSFDSTYGKTINCGNLYDDIMKKPNESVEYAASTSLMAEGQNAPTVPIDQLTSSFNLLANDSLGSSSQKLDEHVSECYGEEVFYMKTRNLMEDSAHEIESPTFTISTGHEVLPSEGCTIENSPYSPENSSSSKPKDKPLALLMKRYIGHVAFEKDSSSNNAACQLNMLNRGSGIGDEMALPYEKPLVVTESQTNSVEIGNMDDIKQSMTFDLLEQAKDVLSGASVESNISLKDHHVHDGSLMSVENMKVASDAEERKLDKPSTPIEGKKDACSHLTENTNLVELCALNSTNYGMQETDKREDSKLGIHPTEITLQGLESSGIQKSAGNELLENDRSILGDIVDEPQENVGEVAEASGHYVEHTGKENLSPSKEGRSLERYDTTIDRDGGSSNVQNVLLLSEKRYIISPASSDNLNPRMDGERLQNSFAQSQSECTCILEVHEERAPADMATQVESGDAVNFKETSLPIISLQSEPCLLKHGDGDPSSPATCCVSPVVSCTQPSSDELHQQVLKKGVSDQRVPQSANLSLVSSFCKSPEENKPMACNIKESNASVEDRSFMIVVGSPSDTAEREAADQWKASANMQPDETLQGRERCLARSGSREDNLNVLRETPNEILASAEVVRKSTKRSKTASCSVSERRTASKRKSVKETLIVKQADERDENPCSKPLNTVGNTRRTMQVGQSKQNSHNEGDSVQPSCSSSLQTSNLPISETAPAFFHQPFTDKQQVQLRAQIFVYGSLIQGVPPDEACMISAFGNSDDGQTAWEDVWRVAQEKFHNQKPPTINLVTPSHSHSGVRFLEKISPSPLQSKTHSISVSSTSQSAHPVTSNSSMSLLSPLCNVSTCGTGLHSNVSEGPYLHSSEIFFPLHSPHSSHGKKYAGNNNPWVSQASLPLVASPQASILDARAHFLLPPVAATSHVTPIRNSSVPYSPNLQLTVSSSFTTAGVSSTPLAATTVQIEPTTKVEPSRPEKHATANQKTRRKKSVVPELPAQLLPHPHPHAEVDSTAAVMKCPPTSAGYTMPTISPVGPSTDFQAKDSHGNKHKVVALEETCSKIMQAILHAEEAAAAIRHSEGIWSQLSTQKNSELVSETDMKLAYAAVAAAAASSVAKAAAAAAKVASDAALQAKMMADEALSSGTEISVRHSESAHVDGGPYLSGKSSTLMLKGKDKTDGSRSVISAAKEASRRRVEAASAAAKRAENLDTIVKSAELAAVAVSQAGAIIAMRDPLPFTLNDLIEAGPEACRKVQQSTAVMHKEKHKALACADGSKSVPQLRNAPLNEKYTQQIANEEAKSFSSDGFVKSTENFTGAVAVHPPDISTLESEKDQIVVDLKGNSIQEGSLVEVLSSQNGLRRVWFSASVLSLRDGKAFVCYKERPKAGSDRLKEWIPLEDECDKPPRIRIAHPTLAVKYEGTRKRRRAAMANYVWAVGDRVDAWLHDGWCEGIVTEMSKEDKTKLIVHFPAGGDTSDFRAWHLRPSLIWKDGQWIEWSRPRENVLRSCEGCTPQGKRQKLIRFEEKDNAVLNIDANQHPADIQTEDSQKPEESGPSVLSQKGNMFSVRKNVREETNSDTFRVKRTSLQKEGSKIIFGIPKPGKRMKFMEVSKHYVSEKPDNATDGSDSIKFVKYLVPQSCRVWKNAKSDPKGAQGGEPKPKLLRSIRPSEGMQTRSTAEKEGSLLSISTSSVVTASHEENSERNLLETASISNDVEVEGNKASDSQQCPVPGITSSKNKTINVGSDVGVKGKVTPFAVHPGKRILGSVEPRRSNRRFQPTSRLLEGLQSSMVVAKIPVLSHEKGAGASNPNAPSSGEDVDG